MKILFTFATLLILLISPAFAGSEWDKTDKLLFSIFTIFNIVDYSQTRYISEHSDKYHEANPILKDKNEQFITLYFGGYILTTWLLSNELQSNYRKALLISLSSSALTVIGRNVMVGIKLSF